ncbi:IS21 family transposase [Bacillus sp. m3-13]|uniref:IS21 family transposase n=1 Tax=Bacillus sp. m3-13 TaxID=406124 RepID=UPI0001E89DB3|nr:IS21 family transposase [Bacillus sp. m3-13]
MKKWMRYMDIFKLKQKGFSISAISKKLGISRNTVYSYIKMTPEEFDNWIHTTMTRRKRLDTYHDQILAWLKEHQDLSGAQVHDWLKEHHEEFDIGESTVRGYVKELREKYSIPKRSSYRQYQSVEDLPMGKQAQVDFGETYAFKTNGSRQKLWFIAFVLSTSRYKFVSWLDRPFTTRDVIQAHEAAFHYYGGMPEELVYDQDHLIAVSENAGDIILTKEFQAYQQLRKFGIYLCRKSDPETKGKIENVVKFVKYNFSKNRVLTSLEVWNEQSINWLARTGNYNVHHTTKKRPFEVHALEKQHLQKVSTQFSFENNHTGSITRNIRKDNVISYESNRYSVPTGTYRPKKSNVAHLEITEENRLLIRLNPGGKIIANHMLVSGRGKLVQDKSHKRKRSTKLAEWEAEIVTLFEDQVKAQQFISSLKERYPRHMGDQLTILWNLLQQEPLKVNPALDKALELRLTSANDLRDLLVSVIQEEPIQRNQDVQSESPYSHIHVTTRKVESYIEILKGGQSA